MDVLMYNCRNVVMETNMDVLLRVKTSPASGSTAEF